MHARLTDQRRVKSGEHESWVEALAYRSLDLPLTVQIHKQKGDAFSVHHYYKCLHRQIDA